MKTSLSGIKGLQWVDNTWRMFLFCFIVTRSLFTLSLLNKVKRWTSFVWKYWQGYMRLLRQKRTELGLMLGFCIMAMPLFMKHSLSGCFWPKNRYWNWTTHHIRQVWPRATFSYFQNRRPLWRATAFQTLPTFNDMRRPSWRAFQKCSSRKVLGSGNTDLIIVLVRKETTSKVTATIGVWEITAFTGIFRELNCHTS